MTLAIKYATDFIQAIEDPRLFTQIVDGEYDAGTEMFKRVQDGSTVTKSIGTGVVFTVASLVTIPWELISKVKNGRFYLRGFGFLCPLIALGAFALARYYSVLALNHMNTVTALQHIHIFKQPPANLKSIAEAAEDHFNRAKSEAQESLQLKAESLSVLIRLHYLKKHCTDLAERWTTVKLARLYQFKRDHEHYPSYTELFTINADFLHASSEKKKEMVANRATLVTTKDGKSLSYEDVCKELGLQNANS